MHSTRATAALPPAAFQHRLACRPVRPRARVCPCPDHPPAQGHPTYHKAYKGSMDTVSSISSTPLYQKAKSDLYPTVAPYVDPALEKISHNSYYKAGVDHLKPVQSNGKLS